MKKVIDVISIMPEYFDSFFKKRSYRKGFKIRINGNKYY